MAWALAANTAGAQHRHPVILPAPPCGGLFSLELEFSMADIQTESKSDILFLPYVHRLCLSFLKTMATMWLSDAKCHFSPPHLKSSTPVRKTSWSHEWVTDLEV